MKNMELTTSTRENPENVLYEAWKEAAPDTRQEAAQNLLPYIRSHAAKVCWMVLHRYQSDIVSEIADDALLDLEKFEGRSLFSTWFHVRAVRRCRLELRRARRRKEVSLSDPNIKNLLARDTHDVRSSVGAILDRLSPEDREFIRLKIEEGLTDKELSDAMGISRQAVQRLWKELRKRLRALYGRTVVE